jgi:hypothetical protein
MTDRIVGTAHKRAKFEMRLGAAKTALSQSESMLASMEKALARMEGGWQENVKLMELNVDRLDGLLNLLNKWMCLI